MGINDNVESDTPAAVEIIWNHKLLIHQTITIIIMNQ